MESTGDGSRFVADELANAVVHFLSKNDADPVPHIETIQDMVEKVLMEMGHPSTAKEYILYRDRRARRRREVKVHRSVAPDADIPRVETRRATPRNRGTNRRLPNRWSWKRGCHARRRIEWLPAWSGGCWTWV